VLIAHDEPASFIRALEGIVVTSPARHRANDRGGAPVDGSGITRTVLSGGDCCMSKDCRCALEVSGVLSKTVIRAPPAGSLSAE
jgi:hypothetical protein